MSQIIDGILKDWGERIYNKPVSGQGPKRTVTRSRTARPAKPLLMAGSARVREKLILTTRKTPEVMVKISGGGKSIKQVKAHLDYISRNGLVELENEDGEIILGREAVDDVRDEWKSGQYGLPENGSCRETFNIVLSMPPGTERRAVKDAIRAFAQAEFSDNHAYVFAIHDDEAHPHGHLCVKSLGFDGSRLNPRKADLQRWRERFAEALRERGVEANATPRRARADTREVIKQATLHATKNGKSMKADAEQDRCHIGVSRAIKDSYGHIARALAKGNDMDKSLALAIVQFLDPSRATTPPIRVRLRSSIDATKEAQRRGSEDRSGKSDLDR
ncbi:relaxase/mobilization nuclease domain-containing protein [Achromobacter xylosoxidans]|uniref:relaxase/mobilization nuclease domain-containing protein n=1 Tax=Alcaligenes xylosoxydans xylosoxydans TaxID=85698 RepID=UPI0015650940|nr:relaxase/mobilization nuclease domain-containing protein [Achromobacter xylosoxidans]QKI75194.1 relaxase/mobilization nuclease domain-containing protein [Achromobacter xylosoxidans]